MKYLYFIRHGEQDNIERYYSLANLTSLGRNQAENTGIKLKQLGCQKIYSSDLPRAKQTSEIINRHLKADITYLPGFREISYGDWDGLTVSAIKKDYSELLEQMGGKDADIPYPGGEAGYDVYKRVQDIIKKHICYDPAEHIAIVSHGELILSLICGIRKIGFEKRFDVAWLDHCGITLITHYPITGEMDIKYINNISHLSHFQKQ